MDKMNTIATLVSGQDMLFIFLIVLVLFGAKKLPELAKGMGQAVREFNKAKDEIEREMSKPVNEMTVQPAPNAQAHGQVAAAPAAAELPAQPAPVAPPPPAPAPAAPTSQS
jgi:sec-independent protein translocase protein TatA